MSWTASRADKHFSGVRSLSDAVQPPETGAPPCCARTRVTIRCRHDERAFVFSMPTKGRPPWLSATVPPQNLNAHVMADTATPVLQVVSSATEAGGMDAIILRAEGPGECPPGTPSLLTVTPPAGTAESRTIPLRDWTVPLPAGMGAALLDTPKPWERTGVHPFCLPELPAQTWRVAFPACPVKALGMSMAVKVFPAVHWTGSARVEVNAADGWAHVTVQGGLELRIDGRSRTISDWPSLRTLFPMLGMMDELTKTVNAIRDFTSEQHSRGLDSGRLQWREAFHWHPAPSLGVQVESRLFEQPQSGLVGHYLEVRIAGEPLAGAEGESNVLPVLLTNAAAEKMLAPFTAGRRPDVAELSTRCGLYFVAEGRCSFAAAVRAVRPLEMTTQKFRSDGSVAFALEGRSENEWESITVFAGAEKKPEHGCALSLYLEAPPDSPLPEPRERKPKLQAHFSGMALRGITRHSGGVRIRALNPPPPEGEEPKPVAIPLLPARTWPQGTEPGASDPIPWCA